MRSADVSMLKFAEAWGMYSGDVCVEPTHEQNVQLHVFEVLSHCTRLCFVSALTRAIASPR